MLRAIAALLVFVVCAVQPPAAGAAQHKPVKHAGSTQSAKTRHAGTHASSHAKAATAARHGHVAVVSRGGLGRTGMLPW